MPQGLVSLWIWYIHMPFETRRRALADSMVPYINIFIRAREDFMMHGIPGVLTMQNTRSFIFCFQIAAFGSMNTISTVSVSTVLPACSITTMEWAAFLLLMRIILTIVWMRMLSPICIWQTSLYMMCARMP